MLEKDHNQRTTAGMFWLQMFIGTTETYPVFQENWG